MVVTGEVSPDTLCKCNNDYLGDRITIMDDSILAMLAGMEDAKIDISGFMKSISFIENRSQVLPPRTSSLLKSFNQSGMKFLAVLIPDMEKVLYWKHQTDSVLDKSPLNFITAMTLNMTSFSNDLIGVSGNITLTPDNSTRWLSWVNPAEYTLNGVTLTSWDSAQIPWREISPFGISNTYITSPITAQVSGMANQDRNGNFTGEASTIVSMDSTQIRMKVTFSGTYPTAFAINTITMEVDGEYVGVLSHAYTVAHTYDINLRILTANITGTASSTKTLRYNKVHGLLFMSSNNVQNIQDVLLFNPHQEPVPANILIAG